MTTVFLLVIYLGDAVQQSDMHFRDINRCRYFANRISKQPAVPGIKKKYIYYKIRNIEAMYIELFVYAIITGLVAGGFHWIVGG